MEYKLRFPAVRIRNYLLKTLLAVLVLFLMGGSFYAGFDPHDGRIAENVCVGGIDLGGMTPERAYRELKYASQEVLERSVLWVDLPQSSIPLEPQNTKVSLNCYSALWAAWKAGRFGNQDLSISLAPHLKLDQKYIRHRIDLYADHYDTDMTAPSTYLAGPMPDLELENQSSKNRPQTLELTLGLPTTRLDREDAFQQILAVYDSAFAMASTAGYRVTGPFRVDLLEEPEAPDLQKIYEDVYIPPVDDSLDMKNHSVIPGAYGYHFNLEAAQQQADQAKFGETLYIAMEFQEPEIFGEGVYFRDVLGYCETKHTSDENRNNNLRRACESMNGKILQPGDVFSYNDTLGQRTKENGYLRSGAYSGWELVQSYGGGICQGSSTLYCAALYADLEIIQRKNHGYRVGYLEAGLDATVNWGGPDFQFRNNTHFPVKIAAEVSDGFVKISLLGTEERNYYVEMETEVKWGSSTIYAKSFKCKYDRSTGELLSRELEAKSNYMR